MRKGNNIQKLNLSKNPIEKGAKKLAKALVEPACKLKHLVLMDCQIKALHA